MHRKLLDHKSEMISAFALSLQLTDKANLSEALEASMGRGLRRGREPSMHMQILRTSRFDSHPQLSGLKLHVML